MNNFTDQLNRTIALPAWPPRRIVSLVPSQTELLADLGLEEQVVGITKFCVHPAEWFQTKPRVGGTKTLNFEKIADLQPDLILGNKEENDRGQIETLARHYPVWLSEVRTLDDAWDMMLKIGALTGTTGKAENLIQEIQTAFAAPPASPAGRRTSYIAHRTSSAAYFIWRKPYMVAGGDTFIQSMLEAAGFDNVFATQKRYPEITLDELAAASPEVILLSSEPYPFAEKHFAPLQEACPGVQIRVVDGELFSWYGSRLRYAPAYFAALQTAILDKK